MDLARLFTSFSGRIPRSAFWIGFAAIVLVYGVGRYVLKQHLDDGGAGTADPWVMLWSVLAVVPLTAVFVKRLNDRARPAWIGYAAGATIALFMVAPHFGYLGEIKSYSPVEHVVFWTLLPLSLFAYVEAGFLPARSPSDRDA